MWYERNIKGTSVPLLPTLELWIVVFFCRVNQGFRFTMKLQTQKQNTLMTRNRRINKPSIDLSMRYVQQEGGFGTEFVSVMIRFKA